MIGTSDVEARLRNLESLVNLATRDGGRNRDRIGQFVQDMSTMRVTRSDETITVATITVRGCNNVLMSGLTVVATLGSTTTSGVTNGSGVVVLTLNGYGTWTLAAPGAPALHYQAAFGTIGGGGGTTGATYNLVVDYPTWACFGSCSVPVPETLYLRDGLGMVVTLTYDPFNQRWNGCDTGSVVAGITTKDCAGVSASGGVIPRYWTLIGGGSTMSVSARYPSTLLSFGGTPIRGVSSATWCALAPFNVGTVIPGCSAFVGVNSVGSNAGTFTCSPCSATMTGTSIATPALNGWSMFYPPSTTVNFTVSET